MQIDITWEVAGLTVLVTLAALLFVVALVRLYGLRSFAKMAAHEFAATVAMGSLLAATAGGSIPLVQGCVSLGALFFGQWVFQRVRVRGGESIVDNTPVLLMAGPVILYDVLRSKGVTEADLRGKLREANVLHLEQVRAVVLEATGDVSVLHGPVDGPLLDPVLLEGVQGRDEHDGSTACWRGHAADAA